jgi:titin
VRAANAAGTSAYSNTATATTSAAPTGTGLPTAPSGLVAQAASSSEIQLTWGDNSNNEESFRVEQATGTGAFAQVQTLAAGTTSVRITGLAASTAYSFRVRAANIAGTSAYSNTGSATTSAAVTGTGGPAAPTNLVAQAVSTTEIMLTWQDNATNEDNYRVEQLINGVFTQISQRAQNATSFKIIGLAQGTAYTFRVRGKNATGYSTYSNEASAATQGGTPPPASLEAPSQLTAVAVSGTEIMLTWRDNSTDEANFLIERSIGGGAFTQFNMRGANVTSFRVTGVTTGTTYSFRVRAKNATGTSAYSNTASATLSKTIANPPAAPVGLQAKAASRNAIDLTWQDKSTNETEFRIERLVNGAYREIRKVGANQSTARISGLSAGTSYTFRVRAVNPASSSRYSNRASATTRGSR